MVVNLSDATKLYIAMSTFSIYYKCYIFLAWLSNIPMLSVRMSLYTVTGPNL